MSFALTHQSKNNKAGDAKTSTPTKHYSSSTQHHHLNNLNRDSADYIFQLQRAIGNQAVQRLIRSKGEEFDFSKIGLQPKLKISQPNDVYEQEADKVAEQVMRMPVSSDLIRPTETTEDEGIINRKCATCEMKEKKEDEDEKRINISRKPSSTLSNLEADDDDDDEIANEINNIRSSSGGSSLDPSIKEFMETRFGYDFTKVRIHTDAVAARSANSVNALAYTVGNDIVFAQGQYQTSTESGRRLLAHELTHAVQQDSNPSSNLTSRKPTSEEGDVKDSALQTRLDEIERKYRGMIVLARVFGHDVAADNLERFLAGTGGVKTESVEWLLGFVPVKNAVIENRIRFELSLIKKAEKMVAGVKATKTNATLSTLESESFCDYWDKTFTATLFTELYYASGTSNIRSSGAFTLFPLGGQKVSVIGTVSHHWCDPYDWHAGLDARIPGFGNVSDTDAILMQKHRGARPFLMEANWSEDLDGEIDLGWFGTDFTWGDPSVGGIVTRCPGEKPDKACEMP